MVVNNKYYKDIITPELLEGCIDHNPMEGFLEDYRTLHCLIRKYQPKTFFEIGTCRGEGLNVICNAKRDMAVYSLDLPNEQADKSLQHPTRQSVYGTVGYLCRFPYTQLFGDSLQFSYQNHPCEGYFIDGEHDLKHAYEETAAILMKCSPKLIVWHDADIKEVYDGIEMAFYAIKSHEPFKNPVSIQEYYDIFRVVDTRILYAVRKF